MIDKKIRGILIISLAAIFLVLFNVNAFSIISLNGSGSGYEEGDPGSGKTAAPNTIEGYVIEGAGYYLQGLGLIQQVLYRVELQGSCSLDDLDFQQLVDSALEKIQAAGSTYEQLIAAAGKTPYNPVVIEQLRVFDYDGFQTGNHLNAVIFKVVGLYLEKGDITGLYRYMYSSLKTLEFLLKVIKYQLSFFQIPNIAYFRHMNEICAETSLLGSYTARVFERLSTAM